MAIIFDLASDEYHNGEGVSSSGLKLVLELPAKFYARYIDPNRERKEPTPAMVFGTHVHTETLEPERFAAEYAIRPDVSAVSNKGKTLAAYLENPTEFAAKFAAIPDGIGKSKEGKALVAEIEASGRVAVDDSVFKYAVEVGEQLAGKTLVTADEYERIKKTAAAVLRHPANDFILSMSGGIVEASIYWDDDETGVLCKVRPDWHLPPCERFPNGIIFDLKSAEDASPTGFARSAVNFGYPLSAAMYQEGYMKHYGTSEPPEFLFGVVEKENPNAAACYVAGVDFIKLGRQEFRKALSVYADCVRRGIWPAYSQAIETLELPDWAAKQIEVES